MPAVRIAAFGALAVASALALTPSAASAAYLITDGVAAKTVAFSNPTECSEARVGILVPEGSRDIRVNTGPEVGEQLANPAGTRDIATTTDVDVRPDGDYRVLRTAEPLPGGCSPRYGDPIDIDENGDDIFGPPIGQFWKTEAVDFEVGYERRKTVELTRPSAARLADEALGRRFNQAYTLADTGYPRCRAPRRNSSVCTTSFFQGDAEWSGRVRVGVATTRDHRKLNWSYRLNVVLYDSYCGSALHKPFSQCSTRIRKARKRIPVPGGRL